MFDDPLTTHQAQPAEPRQYKILATLKDGRDPEHLTRIEEIIDSYLEKHRWNRTQTTDTVHIYGLCSVPEVVSMIYRELNNEIGHHVSIAVSEERRDVE